MNLLPVLTYIMFPSQLYFVDNFLLAGNNVVLIQLQDEFVDLEKSSLLACATSRPNLIFITQLGPVHAF